MLVLLGLQHFFLLSNLLKEVQYSKQTSHVVGLLGVGFILIFFELIV